MLLSRPATLCGATGLRLYRKAHPDESPPAPRRDLAALQGLRREVFAGSHPLSHRPKHQDGDLLIVDRAAEVVLDPGDDPFFDETPRQWAERVLTPKPVASRQGTMTRNFACDFAAGNAI